MLVALLDNDTFNYLFIVIPTNSGPKFMIMISIATVKIIGSSDLVDFSVIEGF